MDADDPVRLLLGHCNRQTGIESCPKRGPDQQVDRCGVVQARQWLAIPDGRWPAAKLPLFHDGNNDGWEARNYKAQVS